MNVASETTPSSLTDSSIPSQNGGSNVTTVSTPAVSVNTDSVQKARMNATDQIAGYIFMCNSSTKPDCFIYRVFGLPASRLSVAEKIKPNTKLFLYDFEVKLLYGMYVADSSGKMAIEPYAFEGRFPAQVKFSILRDCLPLPEATFKEAIKENYSGGSSKFKQTLTEEQVNDLVSRFRPINISLPLRPPPLLHDAVEICHPANGGPTFQNTNFSSHGQYSSGYDHTNMQLTHPTHNQRAVARTHLPVVAHQPLHSQASFSQHNQVLVPETYRTDHSRLYEQDTHTRYYAPNPMPESHTSQQPRSSMTVAQWVALASEAQTPIPHASSSTSTIPLSNEYQPPYNYNSTSTVPSSNEYQLPYNYNNPHLQTQAPTLPQQSPPPPPPPGVESAYTYYNSTTTQPTLPSPQYQYQGYQASTVQVASTSNGASHVSETYATYGATTVPPEYIHHVSETSVTYGATTMPPDYVHQNVTYGATTMPPEYVHHVSETYVTYGGATTVPTEYVHQMPAAAEVSTDPRTGYVPAQYFEPNPTY